jgi:tetratricopeptide (TPR) repeat protein
MKKKISIVVFLLFVVKAEAQSSVFAVIDSVLEKGNYKVALKLLSEVNPPNFESNVKTAKIYGGIEEHTKAIFYYEKALTFEDDMLVNINIGNSYQKLDNDKKAIEIFEKVLVENPDNLLLKYQLGKLYLTDGKATKAIATFKDLISKDKENANYSYQLARGYALNRKRDLSINSFLDAYQKDKTHLKSIYQLANSYYLLRDEDSTALFINVGLKLDKNHINLNRLNVNRFYKKKDYLQAIEVLKHLDSIEPNETYTQNMMAKSYYNLSEYELAKSYFEKSIKIDRSDYKIYTYLGNIETELGNLREANMKYVMAIMYGKVDMDDEYYGMAIVLLKEDKKQDALRMLNKAYEENRNNEKVVYQLALVEDALHKDKKKAYRLYKDYINSFESKDSKQSIFVKTRIKEIEKDYFFRGEKLD